MTSKQMKSAHLLAKNIVDFVGDYKIALKIAMKKLWDALKKGKKRFGKNWADNVAMFMEFARIRKIEGEQNFFGIPGWVINKNLNSQESVSVKGADSCKVERETEKAILVSFDTDFGRVFLWSPKSVIVEDSYLAEYK